MSRATGVLGFVIATTLLLPNPATAQEWSAAQREVWAAVEALWAASGQSAEAWAATISEDYRGMAIGGPGPTTKAQGRAFREHIVASTTLRARVLVPMSIDIHDDVAIVYYGYQQITETAAAGEVAEIGRWVDVYKNTNGRWLLIADYGGPNPSS